MIHVFVICVTHQVDTFLTTARARQYVLARIESVNVS